MVSHDSKLVAAAVKAAGEDMLMREVLFVFSKLTKKEEEELLRNPGLKREEKGVQT